MKIHENLEQGSASWYQARLGVVTASEADALVTPKWAIRKGDGVESYICRKLAEKILNYSPDQLNTYSVDQGKILETIALPWYEFTFGRKVKKVGFCSTDDSLCGCSPDGMLDDGSGLEIKSPQAPNHLRYLLGGTVPDDYLVQVQFSLWVTKAPYWTFVSFNLTLPPLVLRVQPSAEAQDSISRAVEAFGVRFKDSMNRINQIRETA